MLAPGFSEGGSSGQNVRGSAYRVGPRDSLHPTRSGGLFGHVPDRSLTGMRPAPSALPLALPARCGTTSRIPGVVTLQGSRPLAPRSSHPGWGVPHPPLRQSTAGRGGSPSEDCIVAGVAGSGGQRGDPIAWSDEAAMPMLAALSALMLLRHPRQPAGVQVGAALNAVSRGETRRRPRTSPWSELPDASDGTVARAGRVGGRHEDAIVVGRPTSDHYAWASLHRGASAPSAGRSRRVGRGVDGRRAGVGPRVGREVGVQA